MRRKMERLVLLPFSVGCISESSVAVGIQQSGRSKLPHSNSSPRSRGEKVEDGQDEEAGETLLEESLKNSQKFSALAKPNIAVGFHRIYRGFKNISQLFVYKEEMEEMEMEMEIGSPTDVKHVTHIGCDIASTRDHDDQNVNNNPFIANWETLLTSELLSVPSSTWSHFDDDHQLSNHAPPLSNVVHHHSI